jgi:hypothetical protein
MATLKVSEEQLRLIQHALDFYSRVGIGQFNVIKEHPTFERHLYNEFKDKDGKTDYGKYHSVRDEIDTTLNVARNMLYNDSSIGKNGSWGIHNPKVDDSCRDAYDLIQVIRHEFWKQDPNKSSITVDSSVYLTDSKNSNIEVKI